MLAERAEEKGRTLQGRQAGRALDLVVLERAEGDGRKLEGRHKSALAEFRRLGVGESTDEILRAHYVDTKSTNFYSIK